LAFLLPGIEDVQSSWLGSRKDEKEGQGAKEKKAAFFSHHSHHSIKPIIVQTKISRLSSRKGGKEKQGA
jgi:hypothetical protein